VFIGGLEVEQERVKMRLPGRGHKHAWIKREASISPLTNTEGLVQNVLAISSEQNHPGLKDSKPQDNFAKNFRNQEAEKNEKKRRHPRPLIWMRNQGLQKLGKKN